MKKNVAVIILLLLKHVVFKVKKYHYANPSPVFIPDILLEF